MGSHAAAVLLILVSAAALLQPGLGAAHHARRILQDAEPKTADKAPKQPAQPAPSPLSTVYNPSTADSKAFDFLPGYTTKVTGVPGTTNYR